MSCYSFPLACISKSKLARFYNLTRCLVCGDVDLVWRHSSGNRQSKTCNKRLYWIGMLPGWIWISVWDVCPAWFDPCSKIGLYFLKAILEVLMPSVNNTVFLWCFQLATAMYSGVTPVLASNRHLKGLGVFGCWCTCLFKDERMMKKKEGDRNLTIYDK